MRSRVFREYGADCNAGTQQDESSKEATGKAMDSAFQRKEWEDRLLQTIAKTHKLRLSLGGTIKEDEVLGFHRGGGMGTSEVSQALLAW